MYGYSGMESMKSMEIYMVRRRGPQRTLKDGWRSGKVVARYLTDAPDRWRTPQDLVALFPTDSRYSR